MKNQNKIKVLHFCNQLSLGGTERTMEIFCRLLDPEIFDVYAVTRTQKLSVLRFLRLKLGALVGHKGSKDKLHLQNSKLARLTNFKKFLPNEKIFLAHDDAELERIILSIKPHVLHVHYSGRAEAPLTSIPVMNSIPAIFTTNQFEIENTSPLHQNVTRMFFVSQWLLDNKAHWAKSDPRAAIMYNPCDLPESASHLRHELSIPEEAFVIGRVGRADPGIHDPISLEAYSNIQSENTWFLALNAPSNMIEDAKRLKLKNFVALPGTANSIWLSKFYNTIDVLAHARRDGETFGCNIAEAMMHGKPVVSHLCDAMNAQLETVADGGSVVAADDSASYGAALKRLMEDKAHYTLIAQQALNRAKNSYESNIITKNLEHHYKSALNSNSKLLG